MKADQTDLIKQKQNIKEAKKQIKTGYYMILEKIKDILKKAL